MLFLPVPVFGISPDYSQKAEDISSPVYVVHPPKFVRAFEILVRFYTEALFPQEPPSFGHGVNHLS